jgi:UDP-glucose 4-epimerase
MGMDQSDDANEGTDGSKPLTLVTGGGGLLGTCVVQRLRAAGHPVAILDDGSAGTHRQLDRFATDPMISVHRIDLRNREAVGRVCADEQPSYVVHLAGRHFIPECEVDPDGTWQVNVHGTHNLLVTLAEQPPARLIFASTADVYRDSLAPHREGDPVEPPTAYGRSKLAAEDLIARMTRSWHTAVVTARLFNLYGPGHTVEHLIPTVVEQAVHRGMLNLGNLHTVRDYVYVEDAAYALLALQAAGLSGTFNVGTGVGTSGNDLVGRVSALLKRELFVTLDPDRLRRHNRRVLVADTAKLRAHLPQWDARTLDHGLRVVIARTTQRLLTQEIAGRGGRI